LKLERWGSPLVQEEKYRGEKACDRDNNNNNNNIIIIIITMLRCIVTGTVITDQTTYNNRPNTVTLDKTIKEAY